jgi:hypothetical protein
MQDLEPGSLLMGAEHSQKVKAAPIKSDYGSRGCVDLASSTAESRFNQKHVFVAIPGELSTVYKQELSQGHQHLSILGLVNDAHGYILRPEAWDAKTMESGLSFGGQFYGQDLISNIKKCE